MKYFNKKSIWQWVVLYFLVGLIAYGTVYYFFFNKNGKHIDEPQNYQMQNSNPETADWKTYENKQGKFSLQYPFDWKVEEYNNDPSGTKYVIFFGNEGGIYIDYVNGKYTECINGEMIKMDLGGEQFDVCHYVVGISESWGFQTKDYGNFSIGLSADANTQYSSNRNVILKILSTFKFTELQSEITNWRTYRNSEYGFEISYPSYFYVEEIIKRQENVIFTVDFYKKGTESNSLCGGYFLDIIPTTSSINEWLSQIRESLHSEDEAVPFSYSGPFEPEDINIQGYVGKKLKIKRPIPIFPFDGYFGVINDGKLYELKYSMPEYEYSCPRNYDTFDTMVSTFKFTK